MYASMFIIVRHIVAEVMGRLDHLVEAVYDRFKDRYFEDESAYLIIYHSLTIALAIDILRPL